jgi:hypothetical protein
MTQTVTLGKDGSMSVVNEGNITGKAASSVTTTYVGGEKFFENDPVAASSEGAVLTRATGSTITYNRGGGDDYEDSVPATPGTPVLPATDLDEALRAYKADTTGPMQHSAHGYGAWLEGSFFAAYTLKAEDDALRNDPDETAHKIIWGGREHDSAMASSLSGRGATATWKGMMVGHDMDADAATFGELLKGNASITARLGGATVGDYSETQSGSTASLVDVALTNIINAAGKDARMMEIMWEDLDLLGAYAGDGAYATFSKGSEISGAFYDNGNEVVGEFNKHKVLGVFGAVEYMDDMMDDSTMADSQ